MSRRKVPELDTPFSSVEWPIISQENQDTILELLCSFLSPIGQHSRDHVNPSRGKRSRRRKQQAAGDSTSLTASTTTDAMFIDAEETAPDDKRASDQGPPPPELLSFVDVGLAAVTRELAKKALPGSSITPRDAPKPAPPSLPTSTVSTTSTTSPPSSSAPYAAVFVVRSGHPSAFYSHFPQMVAVASQQTKQTQQTAAVGSDHPPGPIRLVGFSRACEDRLSASLGIPRVSTIALRAGAPQSQGLLKFLEETVPAVDVQWLDEARTGKFRDTQIHIADVSVGPKRQKKMA